MTFSLIVGFSVCHGHRTLELVRQLNSDEYQFEDTLTRRATVIKRSVLLRRIWDKTYQIITAGVVRDAPTLDLSLTEQRATLDSLSEKAQNEIERKLTYVRGLQKAHVTRGQRKQIQLLITTVAARISDDKPPSASSVMAWARAYHNAQLNPLALLGGNATRVRNRRIHPTLDDLVSRMIRTVYLTRDQNSLQFTLTQINAEAKRLISRNELEAGQSSVSLSTLSRRVQEIDLFRRIAAREGHARARMVCRTTIDGAGAAYPLQRVEVDHTPLNWVVVCDRTGLPLGRPLLTIVIDSYSCYILGIYLSFYGAGVTSVSGVIRNTLMPKDEFVSGVNLSHRWLGCGIPDEIFVDNGLEFHSAAFKRMTWELASDLTYCRVRTPWLKPHVERFFATLDYLSLNRGRIHKRVANIMNLDPRKDAAIKFTDLVKGLIMFVADVQPFEVNTRKLARPYDLMSEGLQFCPPVSFPPDMERLRMTTALSKELTVGPGGIELRGLPYGRQELMPLHKRYGERFKTLVKWDPDDLGYLWIQDPKDKTWIESPCRWPEYAIGKSWNQHIVIRNFARQELKLKGAYEDLEQAKLRLHDHWMDATSPRTNADAKLAARFCGVTSASVTEQGSSKKPTPASAIADVEIAANDLQDIPSFDAFSMP